MARRFADESTTRYPWDIMDLRALGLFCVGALLASLQISACGDTERPPAAGAVFDESTDKKPIPYERLPATSDSFMERECWGELPDRATQCGIVFLPERVGSEQTVELAVMRVFSDKENPQNDPLVYLEGGPGGSIIQSLDEQTFEVFGPFAEDRDIIFIDQRGTGATKPQLTCTEPGDIEDALPECFANISEESDPEAYTTVANAADIDEARQALGYQEWNLLGISYGTRLALTLMREYPQGVRSVILDAVVPLEVDLIGNLAPNGQRSFEKTFAACAADDECAEKYPDPMAQLRKVAAELNETPKEFDDYSLTGDDFVSTVFNLLYSPVALGFVPKVIDNADNGDFDLFADLGQAISVDTFAFGMHLSVQCAEELPFTSAEAIGEADASVHPELVGGLSGREYVDYCEYWPVMAAPPIENMPVQSDIPTLVFAGHFDPVTPPSYSQIVHDELDNSEYFLLTSQSHGSSISDCGVKLTNQFLANPGDPVDSACLEDLPSPEFLSQSPAGSHSHTVGGNVDFAVEQPTPEEVERAKEDLKKRALL